MNNILYIKCIQINYVFKSIFKEWGIEKLIESSMCMNLLADIWALPQGDQLVSWLFCWWIPKCQSLYILPLGPISPEIKPPNSSLILGFKKEGNWEVHSSRYRLPVTLKRVSSCRIMTPIISCYLWVQRFLSSTLAWIQQGRHLRRELLVNPLNQSSCLQPYLAPNHSKSRCSSNF